MSSLPEASTAAVGADSSACRASIIGVLEQVLVVRGLTGAQVVTGALSASQVCKGIFRRAMLELVRICVFGEGQPELYTRTYIRGHSLMNGIFALVRHPLVTFFE